MIANKNVALPQAKNKKTTKRSRDRPTAIGRQLGSSRTAAAIVSGASTPVKMINKNAIPCIQPRQVAGLPPLGIGAQPETRPDERSPQEGERVANDLITTGKTSNAQVGVKLPYGRRSDFWGCARSCCAARETGELPR